MSKEQSRTADAERKPLYSLRVKAPRISRRNGGTETKRKMVEADGIEPTT